MMKYLTPSHPQTTQFYHQPKIRKPGNQGTCTPSIFLWNSHQVGRLYSVDWTQDWTVGLDCGTGLTESCAHPISKQHTHYYTAVCLHHMNWIQGRRPSLDINTDRTSLGTRSGSETTIGPDEVSAAISSNVRAIQYVYLQGKYWNKHWPLSNGSTANMHSHTLILSSNSHSPAGKAHMYVYVSVVPRLRADNRSGDENPYTVSRIVTSPKSNLVSA